jgi:hypothetical protein
VDAVNAIGPDPLIAGVAVAEVPCLALLSFRFLPDCESEASDADEEARAEDCFPPVPGPSCSGGAAFGLSDVAVVGFGA